MIRPVLAALTVLAATCALLIPALPAQAAPGDLVCLPPTSSTVTYTPALTTTPQTVTIKTTNLFGPCTSTSNPTITSGTFTGSYLVPNRSCLTLAGSGTSTSTITWNTGQTSTLSLNYTTTIAGAVYTSIITGVVSSGLFAGDSVVSNQTGPATDVLLCTAGLGTVSSIYTVGTITFA
ncbi:hypothetical protein ACFWY5_28230 [Nonomuraea sp. NPDC059007]|uniref:hypothetical protein n=1 Tax=Nonomuraea sp. NPDC059007 TaxID=3346692 RepID=UPI0036A5F1C6